MTPEQRYLFDLHGYLTVPDVLSADELAARPRGGSPQTACAAPWSCATGRSSRASRTICRRWSRRACRPKSAN